MFIEAPAGYCAIKTAIAWQAIFVIAAARSQRDF